MQQWVHGTLYIKGYEVSILAYTNSQQRSVRSPKSGYPCPSSVLTGSDPFLLQLHVQLSSKTSQEWAQRCSKRCSVFDSAFYDLSRTYVKVGVTLGLYYDVHVRELRIAHAHNTCVHVLKRTKLKYKVRICHGSTIHDGGWTRRRVSTTARAEASKAYE